MLKNKLKNVAVKKIDKSQISSVNTSYQRVKFSIHLHVGLDKKI